MAEDKKKRSWQCPKYGSDLKTVREWCKQQVDDGIAFQEQEPGFEQLKESIRILSGYPDEALAAKQRDLRYSKLRTNRLKRNLREMVNSLSEIRYIPGYHSNNNELHDQAEILNKRAQFWYFDQFVDLKIKKGVQWMAISPRGWLEMVYRRMPGERGRAEIDIIPHSFADVVFTGMPESGDHQEAYTGTIIKDLPPYLAHSLWPDKQDQLAPDRETPTSFFEKIREKAKEVVSDVFTTSPEKATAKNPTVRLYYQYILDLSVNRSGKTMKMGYESKKKPDGTTEEVKTPWCYDVPSLGSPILNGYDSDGTPVYKLATANDARIFPGRRLVVFNDRGGDDALYDGPMWDWHGKFPCVKLSGDSWPFGDFSMVHDVSNIQETTDEIGRITHQMIRNRYNPSLKYNMRAVPRNDAKAIRTDVTGQRIGYNGSEGSGDQVVTSLLPKEFYTLDGSVFTFLEKLAEQLDYQMGVRDISAMSKMKAGASADSMEKMMELAGPIVKGISRDMERSMRDLADMFKYMVFQYDTTPTLLRIVGADGITPENYDYNPGNLVPAHLPGENSKFPSVFTEAQRARWLADHLPFIIMPGMLHQITQTSQKLLFLQLWKMGYPLDPWTLGEVLSLGNVGKIPGGANSMIEKWMAWQKMQLEFKASLAAEAQELGGEGGEESNTPGLGPKGGAKGSGGRASTDQTPPKLQQKGDGRTVMRTSQ
jgi:hypothetical protein